MTARHFLGFELPWALVIPLVAGLATTGMALVVSRLFVSVRRTPPPAPAEPTDKPDPDYDPFVQGSASEQRGTLRRGGNPVAVLISQQGQEGPVCHGSVVDRSLGGLCLTVDDPVPMGAVLTIRAVKAPSATPGVDVEVKSCRRAKEAWELGCQFVKTPPWAVLLLFG
jgi:hypothetical protein